MKAKKNVLLVSSPGALLAAFREFHAFHEGWWQSRKGDAVSVICHVFSADATNRSVWLGSKLLSTELESMYLIDPMQCEEPGAWICKRGFADVLRVSDQTAVGSHSLIHKALDGLGCPTWRTCVGTGYPDQGDGDGDVLAGSGMHSVRMFLYTSDGGGDERRFQKIVQVLTMDN